MVATRAAATALIAVAAAAAAAVAATSAAAVAATTGLFRSHVTVPDLFRQFSDSADNSLYLSIGNRIRDNQANMTVIGVFGRNITTPQGGLNLRPGKTLYPEAILVGSWALAP